MKIHKGYKTELKLNNKQKTLCIKSAGVARFAYNWGLNQKKIAMGTESKIPKYPELNRRLNTSKKSDFPWMYEVSKCCPQEALANLENAFNNFFTKRTRFPKFKSKKNGIGAFRLKGTIKVTENTIQLPRLGKLRLKQCGYLPTDIKILSATVSEKAGRWFVSICVEEEASGIIPNKDKYDIVGMDFGIKTLATISDGTIFANPKPLRKNLKKLKRLNRNLSKKKKGSNNRNKAKKKLARLHFKISNIRKDTLHKMTTTLAKNKRVIGIENLSVSKMLKNKRLSREISDVGFFECRRQLEYKGSWYGCSIIVADRFFPSSKTCSVCGTINNELNLKDRKWDCICGKHHDRDFNASCNLENIAAGSTEIKNACEEDNNNLEFILNEIILNEARMKQENQK